MKQIRSCLSRTLVFSFIALFLTSCFTARTQEATDGCELSTKSWKLDFDSSPEGLQIASQRCDSPECILAFVVSGGALAAGSFIVSGSIVLVGNTLHWMERTGSCQTEASDTMASVFRGIFNTRRSREIDTKEEMTELFD